MKNVHSKVIKDSRKFVKSIKKTKRLNEFIDGFNEGINYVERRLQEEKLIKKIREGV